MRLGAHTAVLKPGTLAHRLYGTDTISERHRWEVNPNYCGCLEDAGVVFSAWSSDGLRREMLELPGNYFFLATQFHPEFKSRLWKPSPPYYGLVKAAFDKKRGRPSPEY